MHTNYKILYFFALLLLCLEPLQGQTPVVYGTNNIAGGSSFGTYYACAGETDNNGGFTFRVTGLAVGTYTWERNGIAIPTVGGYSAGSATVATNALNQLVFSSSTNRVVAEYEGFFQLVDGSGNVVAFFYLDVLPAPVISLPTSGSFCVGDNLSATLTGSNGPPLVYSWQAGTTALTPTTPSITITNTGVHRVTVTDGQDCSAAATGPNPGFTPSLSSLVAVSGGSAVTTVCSGNEVVWTATPVTPPTLSNPVYEWRVNGVVDASATGNQYTISSITATTTVAVRVRAFSNTCWSDTLQRTLTVNPSPVTPVIEAQTNGGLFTTSPAAACHSSTVNFRVAGTVPSSASYLWRNGGTTISTSATASLPNINSAQTVTLQLSIGGCSSPLGSINIAHSSNPPQPTLSAAVGGTTLTGSTVCAGSDVVLTAATTVSNPTFRWTVNGNVNISSNATFTINNVSAAQNISVEVQNAGGCWSDPRTLNLSLASAINPVVSVQTTGELYQVNSLSEPINLSNLGTLLNISNDADCGPNPRLSGPGVVDTLFYPSAAVTTSHSVSLTYECPSSDCGVSRSFNVQVYTLSFDKSSYCTGDNITMTIDGLSFDPNLITLGGTSITTFNKNLTAVGGVFNGTIDFSIPSSITGTNTLVLRRAGNRAEEQVTINSRPAAPILTVTRNGSGNLSSGSTICPGDDLVLSATASANSYLWTINGQLNTTSSGSFALSDIQTNLNASLQVRNSSGCTSVSSGVFSATVSTDTTSPSLTPQAVFGSVTVNTAPISLDTNVTVAGGSCAGSGSFSGIGVSNDFFFANVASGSGSIIPVTYNCVNSAGCPLSAKFDVVIGGAALQPKLGSYCLSDTVRLDAVDLTILVDSVTVPLRGGSTVILPLDTSSLSASAGKFTGEVSFVLPNGAVSGSYIFQEAGAGTGQESTAIVVNNPNLGLNLAPEYCSNSTALALSGTPTAGTSTFSLVPSGSPYPSGVLSGSIFNPSQVDSFLSGTGAMRFREVQIVQRYTPTACASIGAPFYPIRDTFQTVVRDVNINSFNITSTTYAQSSGALNLTTFVNPTWGTGARGTFSGSGVVDTSFVVSLVDTGTYTLTFTRQNGGCSAQAADSLRVVPGSDLGLNALYCKAAEADTITRDPNIFFDSYIYNFFRSSTGRFAPKDFINGPTNLSVSQITQFQPISFVSCGTSEGNLTEEWFYGAFRVKGQGIVTLDTTLGQERFLFRPDLVNFSGTDTTITIEFSYINWDRTPFTQVLTDPGGSGCQVVYPAGAEIFWSRTSYQTLNVRIFNPSFQGNTAAAFCGTRTDTIALQAQPLNGIFRLEDLSTGSSIDTLLYGTVRGIVPRDFQVAGQDTTYRLVYDFSGVPGVNACPVDTIVRSIRIVGDYNINFTGRHSNHSDASKRDVYCVNETNDVLSITLGRAAGTGGVITGPGVVQSGGTFFFAPSQAGIGTHTLTLSYTDATGCPTTVQKSFKVVGLPAIAFSGDKQVCVNDALQGLTATIGGSSYTPNGQQDTASFVLQGNPLPYGANYLPANLSVGINPLQIVYVDSSQVATGCQVTITDTIRVFDTPSLSIGGLAPAYCASDANATLSGSPATGGTGQFFGSRIVSGNIFDPDAVALGTAIVTDQVSYTFQDSITTCRDTIQQTVEIRRVPTVALSGLNTQYCPSDPIDNTIAPIITDAAGSQAGLSFTGLGARLISGSLSFRPATLVDSSVTSSVVSLEYSSTSGCVVTLNRTVNLFDSPVVSMANTLDTTYCTNAQAIVFQVTGKSRTGNTVNVTPNLSGGGIPTASQTPAFTQVDSAFNITYDVTYNPLQVNPGQDTVTFLFTDEEGCKNEVSRIVTIDSLPTMALAGLEAFYCAGSGVDTLQGSPAGGSFGSFSSTVAAGLTSTGIFNPSSLAVGVDSLFYTSTGSNGCRDTISQRFEIKALPVVTLTGLSSSYCSSVDTVNLTGTPAGGVFGTTAATNAVDSVTGVFRPVAVGATSGYPISYTVVDGFGCENRATQSTNILSTPNPVNGLSTTNFCTNASSITLTGNPGTSSLDTAFFYLASGGLGITAGAGSTNFSPALATAGVDTVVYQVQNTNGCTAIDSRAIFVVTAPSVTFSGLAPFYCRDTATVSLTPNIAGGTFASSPLGGIVAGNTFSTLANPGNYTVTYTYNDTTTSLVNGANVVCVDNHIANTEIRPLPMPSFTGLDSNYCSTNTASIPLVPAAGFTGGVFSSSQGGIVGNSFLPNQANEGLNTVRYSYTDPSTTCTGITEQSTQVRRQPNSLSFASLNNRYCADATTVFGVQGDLINIPSSTTAPAAGSSVSVTGYGVTGTPTFDNGTGVFQSYDVNYDLNLAAAQNVSQDTVVFVFANEFGCRDTIQQLVLVDTIPNVRFQNLDTIYCQNAGILTLTNTGIPSIFTGSGGEFRSQNNPSAIQNNVEYVLATAALGPDVLIYDYEDDNGCQDTAQWAFEVSAPPVVSFDFVSQAGAVVDTVCEASGPVRLVPNLQGGTFSGSGVVNDTSFTTNIGAGTYFITYVYTDTLTGCSNSFVDSIVVAPLPTVRFTGLDRNAYCQNPGFSVVLVDSSSFGAGYGPMALTNSFFQQTLPDSTVQTFFNDSLVLVPEALPTGQHQLRRIVQDATSGCVASISETVIINPLPDNLEILNVDSTQCREDVILAEGRPAQTANSFERWVLFWNAPTGTVVVDTTLGDNATLVPTTDTLPNGQLLATGSYTYEYLFRDGNGCENLVRDTFRIHPNPVAAFADAPVCEGDTIFLSSISTVSDAISSADSIQSINWQYLGNLTASGPQVAIPTVNQAVGSYSVRLDVTTGVGCQNSVSEANGLEIYANPPVSFTAANHCEGDSSAFVSDGAWVNYLSGLDPDYSDVFRLEWDFGNGTVDTQSTPITDYDIRYVYPSAGAYQVVLTVEVGDSNFVCRSQDSLSFIVSPSISSYPYYQTFDTNGDWFAESTDPNLVNYWRWGLAQGSTIQTTAADSFNNVWKTNPTVPAPMDAWVYGACFDLSSLDRPMIAFDYWGQTEEGLDGTVLEYFDPNSLEWLPLGVVNRGINWFNTNIIAGAPGDQTLAPRGWSGMDNGWQNARYRLDEYKDLSRLRVRFAFGASGSVSAASDGFAFDNFWIGNRQRNTLLETFSNRNFPNMNDINSRLYGRLFQVGLVQDVALLQYHGKEPNPNDEFHLANPNDVSSRELFYKVDNAAEGFKDGESVGDLLTNPSISNTQFEAYFDANILQDPAFKLRLSRAEVTGSSVLVDLQIEALRSLPQDDYVLHIAVLEDSLTYTGGVVNVQAVMRKLLPEAGGSLRSRSWAAGDLDSLSAQWSIPSTGYNPNNFVVLAFIQSNTTEEVFQVVSNRDISGFVVGLEEVTEAERDAAHAALFTAKLFPNPAQIGFTVAFEEPLPSDGRWELFDLGGRLLQSGEVAAQAEQFYVNRQNLNAGMYVLRVQVGNAYVQRRVIFARP